MAKGFHTCMVRPLRPPNDDYALVECSGTLADGQRCMFSVTVRADRAADVAAKHERLNG